MKAIQMHVKQHSTWDTFTISQMTAAMVADNFFSFIVLTCQKYSTDSGLMILLKDHR